MINEWIRHYPLLKEWEQEYPSTEFEVRQLSLIEGFIAMQEAISEAFVPAWQELTKAIHVFYVEFRRIYLSQSLSRYMPGKAAWWLARRWPVSLLPDPDYGACYE